MTDTKPIDDSPDDVGDLSDVPSESDQYSDDEAGVEYEDFLDWLNDPA
jgi:hypothetical protein